MHGYCARCEYFLFIILEVDYLLKKIYFLNIVKHKEIFKHFYLMNFKKNVYTYLL